MKLLLLANKTRREKYKEYSCNPINDSSKRSGGSIQQVRILINVDNPYAETITFLLHINNLLITEL